MPAPSPRNPIRPARGNKIDLENNISQLYDGEICYATDEDKIYVVESGVLIPVGHKHTGTNPGSDDIHTDIHNPKLGEALIYNGSHWSNGGPQDGGNF